MEELPDFLPQLLAICAAPVIVSDRRGRIVLFNGPASRVLGYSPEEAREILNVSDLYAHPEAAREVLAAVRRRPSDTEPTEAPLEVTLRTREGDLVPVRLTATMIRGPEGERRGMAGMFVDRREEQNLGRRLADAAAQVAAAEKKMANLGTVGTLAHAMSQPLTAAMGNVEMALIGPAGREDRLEKAFEQLERLGALLNDLMRLASSRGADAGVRTTIPPRG